MADKVLLKYRLLYDLANAGLELKKTRVKLRQPGQQEDRRNAHSPHVNPTLAGLYGAAVIQDLTESDSGEDLESGSKV